MYIARQPIFTKKMGIYGYELLFRSDSNAETFGNTASAAATANVLGALLEQGIDQVVGRARAFINFDYEFIMSDVMELINPKILVIEVLETVKPDEDLTNRLNKLRQIGYKIALDDFMEKYSSYPIVPIADIIKYDVMATPLDTIEQDVKEALSQNKLLLAEKIETKEVFQKAVEMGFHLFQGYFFSKPHIVGGASVKKSSAAIYSRILNELKKPEPSYDVIVGIIESDASLAYRAMRLISNKQENVIASLKRVLLRMGLKELERWINVLMLQELSTDKPDELMKLSLIRSKFGEFVAANSSYRKRKAEVSMMCLFSLLDAILDKPMSEALTNVMISSDVVQALVYGDGSLEPICKLLSAYERGDWDKVGEAAVEIRINPELLFQGYMEAIQWSARIFSLFD